MITNLAARTTEHNSRDDLWRCRDTGLLALRTVPRLPVGRKNFLRADLIDQVISLQIGEVCPLLVICEICPDAMPLSLCEQANTMLLRTFASRTAEQFS